MSAPRLTFLYPAFYRSIQATEQASLKAKPKRNPLRPQPRAAFSTGRRRHVEAQPHQRYGTANEPPPHLAPQPGQTTAVEPKEQKLAEAQSPQQPPNQDRERVAIGGSARWNRHSDSEEAPEPETHESKSPPPPEERPKEEDKPVQGPYVPPANSIETVLQMPSPAEAAAQEQRKKPPHLQAPPYVHHFDTWSLVRDLEQGGFRHERAVELMKAMRLILAENLDVARDGLVSKSNVENESYLFRAACSELRTEIQNSRKSEVEKMRAQRTALQHEVDILNQKMTQASQSMKDELKGMFDDRKMNVKMEQRAMESRIQELNYKITVTLNSDARSDVESVRWLLTRRAAIALSIVVVAVLGTLRYTAYMVGTQEEERKKLTGTNGGGGKDGNPGNASPGSPDSGISKPGAEEGLLVSESGGRGYVALG